VHVPDIKTVKQRVESLLEREYIARDPQDAAVYVYVP